MIDLNPGQLSTVKAILAEHVPECEVRAFGSRATWTAKDYSDLDLAVVGEGPLDWRTLDRLKEAFEESDLPMRVDVLDWHGISDSFRKVVERDYVVLRKEGTTHTLAPGWPTVSWGDLVTLEYGKSLRGYDTSTGNYRVYGTNGPIGWNSEPLCPHASVIVGRKGAYRGVHYSPDPFFVIDTAFYLKPKVELDTRWAYYQLLTQDINGMDSGSAIPSTSREDFYGLPVEVPPLAEQRVIAHVLGTLDDKIELNRRMNETLEEMARALFKSWFVDFEPVRAKMEGRWRRGESLPGLPAELYDLFPGRLVGSEVGEAPEGWEVRALGDCFDLTMGQSPPGSTYNDDGDGMPFFQGSTDFQFRYPDKRRFCTAPTRIAEFGDTLVSVRAPVGDINMAWERCCIGRGLAALRHKSGSNSFTYYSVWAMQRELQQYEHTGTVFGAINRKQFEALHTVEPDSRVVDAFESCAGQIDGRIKSSSAEARSIVDQRDALIPRLVSGEARVRRNRA